MSLRVVLISLLLAASGWLCNSEVFGNSDEPTNRHLQEEIALAYGVPSEPMTIQRQSRMLFTMDLLPEYIGDLISCSTTADNGEIDLLVNLDASPTDFVQACVSINDSPNESCPVRIGEENSRIYVLVSAVQTTENYVVECGPADVTPLTINVATEPVDLAGGTFILLSTEVTSAVTVLDSVFCTAKGVNGDIGLSIGVDSIPIASEVPANSCQSYTITPPKVGEFSEACNITVSEEDQTLIVYVKAYVDTEAVSVMCRTCEAEFVDGISDVVFGGYTGLIVEDTGMDCIPGWENYTLAPLANDNMQGNTDTDTATGDEETGMEVVTMSPTMEDGMDSISADSGTTDENIEEPISGSFGLALELSGCLVLISCLVFGSG